MKNQPASFQTASLSTNEPVTRALGAEAPPRALVRFAPDARVADITALLDSYQAAIVERKAGCSGCNLATRRCQRMRLPV